jgi:hypothetical protein
MLFLSVVAAAGIASSLSAATISTLYNTGVDAAGRPVADNTPDTHWSLVAPGVQVGTPLVVTSSGGYPIATRFDSGWIRDNSTSAWLGTLWYTALGPRLSEYHYQTTFSLAGLDPASAIIGGQVSNAYLLLDILINGVSAGFNESNGTYAAFIPFGLDAADIALLNGGLNTLTFIVQSGNTVDGTDAYTGLRVEFLTKTANPIPEPGAAALAGLAVFGACLRRCTALR